jgi:hypothetical protein
MNSPFLVDSGFVDFAIAGCRKPAGAIALKGKCETSHTMHERRESHQLSQNFCGIAIRKY